MNIEPGMFISVKGCDIFFEVKSVHTNFVICANRNPTHETELVFIDTIDQCVEKPLNSKWIKLNRQKGYYDKFYPEGWQPYISQVIPFSSIEAGMELIGYKGVFYPVSKKGNTWKCTGSQKTLTSKNNDMHIWCIFQHEKYVGND